MEIGVIRGDARLLGVVVPAAGLLAALAYWSRFPVEQTPPLITSVAIACFAGIVVAGFVRLADAWAALRVARRETDLSRQQLHDEIARAESLLAGGGGPPDDIDQDQENVEARTLALVRDDLRRDKDLLDAMVRSRRSEHGWRQRYGEAAPDLDEVAATLEELAERLSPKSP